MLATLQMGCGKQETLFQSFQENGTDPSGVRWL